MYVVDSDETRRGPRTDADPRHALRYSPFHRDAAMCGTCHDVSNPAFTRVIDAEGNSTYILNTLNQPAPSASPYTQFPVERTYSEWLNSAYNSPVGVYAPQFGGTKTYVSTCQDCHMRDVVGKAAAQGNIATRNDLALHDLTGGNIWVPDIINTFFPGETNAAALAAGKQRAAYMLQNAAMLNVKGVAPNAVVEVTNQTGHKLPSGYPEGRRIWINVKAYSSTGTLLAEFGAYDTATATLTTSNTKVYEIKLGMTPDIEAASGRSNLPDGSSFHFVLNNRVVKDNRIPPRGFTNAAFRAIQSEPVGYSYADGQYWDRTAYTLPEGTTYCVVNLYYQTTSKEYIEFLKTRNTTNDLGTRLYDAWALSGRSRPVLMASFGSATVPIPVITATKRSLPTTGLLPGTVNNPVLAFSLSSSHTGRSFDSLTVQVTGTYSQNDVQKFKLWVSPDETFSSSGDTLLAEQIPTRGGGETITFSGFTQALLTTPKYYFITVDVAPGANPSSSLNARINALSDLAFNSLVRSASTNNFPITGEEQALPVLLVSLTAEVQRLSVVLRWATATEVNNQGFEIERRAVGEEWVVRGFVAGAGTSSGPRLYSFQDEMERAGRYVYRLRLIGADGSVEYSPVVEVVGGEAPREFALLPVFPNPANPTARIEFVLGERGYAVVRIYNILGQVVQVVAEGEFEAGQVHRAVFDGSSLPSGVYYVELSSGARRAVQRLVLMK